MIIGMSAKLPGIEGVEEFWRALLDNKDLTQLVEKQVLGADGTHFSHELESFKFKFGLRSEPVTKLDELKLSAEELSKLDPHHIDTIVATLLALKDAGGS